MGAVRQGPEGLVSAMPHKKNPIAQRAHRRHGPRRARAGRAGHGGHPALARARHQPLLDRAHRAARRVDRAPTTCCTSRPGWSPGLVVDADRMRANLERSGGLIYTSTVLLELVEGGLSREDAYAFVQARRDGDVGDRRAVPRDAHRSRRRRPAQALDEARLDEVCRPERYLERLAPGLRAAGRADVTDLPAAACIARGKVRDALRGRRRPPAAGRQRPALRVRRGPADRGPGQGGGAHRAVGVVVRAARRRRAEPPRHRARRASCPAELQPHADALRGRSMLCRRLDMVPVECVARGYLTGSGLTDYRATGGVCGVSRCRPAWSTAAGCPSRSSRPRPRRRSATTTRT